MKSSNQSQHEKQVPELSENVKKAAQNGIYKIELPDIVNYKFNIGKEKPVPSLQFRCNSLFLYKPNTIDCCHNVIKTVIGKGTGDQTELIECAKCRTSYVIRQIYHEDGQLEIKIAIYDIGRNVQNFCTTRRDKNSNVWVEFNKESNTIIVNSEHSDDK